MSVITKIKPQKDKKRVNIYLDDKFGFGLDLENLVKLNLKVDQELSEGEVVQIVKKAEFSKVSERLLNYASLRPRSEKEITDWLKRKKVNENLHKDLFDKLKHFKLLNDYNFAKWWVEQRLNFKKKSKKEIVYELISKGVKKEIIDEVLAGFDIDEEKIAKGLIEKKKYKWERYGREIREQKMKEFLLRKGFSWNIVSKVV